MRADQSIPDAPRSRRPESSLLSTLRKSMTLACLQLALGFAPSLVLAATSAENPPPLLLALSLLSLLALSVPAALRIAAIVGSDSDELNALHQLRELLKDPSPKPPTEQPPASRGAMSPKESSTHKAA